MKNELKKRGETSKQGGFLELIIIIIVALLLMKYFNITVSDIIVWLKSFVNWFLSFFGSVLR